ncbi:hypothetical protein Tco_1112133 [Tanacetum coccineum]|uniref:Reverse transcriptase domain-containing protein n=1 Tax=Tanacetum coccineum TaxID=301880 RepID=A0ABQ5IPX5_9ASTR
MGDEHLSTIPETESEELIKSSVENLVPTPRESKDLFDIVKFNSENSNAIIESFSSSHILVEDSGSLMEEIDLFLTPDDSMPPGIENDNYDSEGDILFLEEFLSNDPPSLPENESFHFVVPSSPRPPAKSSDDGIYFEPDTGLLTAKVVISDFSESPMMIYGGNIPTLDVPIAPDYESSRARGFVLRSLKLQSFA